MAFSGSGTKLAELESQRLVTREADWQPPLPSDYKPLDGLPEKEGSPKEKAWACLSSHLTILQWLPYYKWGTNLFYDVSGGATIALICLVQTLAHASIATTSVIQGPYCAFVPPFVYAMLGTSPHASISSGAIAAILIADQLSGWPDIRDRTELATLLSFMSGIMLVLCGVFKMAFLVRFLSQSLLSGFITAGSFLILIGQLGNLFGITTMPEGVPILVTANALIEKIFLKPEFNTIAVCMGVGILCVLQLLLNLKKYCVEKLKQEVKPKWAKPVKILTEMKELLLVFTSILGAWLTSSTDAQGETTTLIPTVGSIPSGLPPYHAPWDYSATKALFLAEDTTQLRRFIFGSFLVAVTTFLTTYTTTKKQALMHGYELNAGQEMFALGMAGTCGSFFGSFPPSGSLSRTSLASDVGVKSQMSGLMKIFVVGGSLKFLTPVLYFLPKPTLAAIILRSTWSLVDFDTPRTLIKNYKPRRFGGHRRDFLVWLVAFVLTIWKGVIWGVGVAVVVSVLMIVKDSARPRMVVLGRLPMKANVWRDREVWPESISDPGLLVVEFRGPISFASADHFQEELQRIRLKYDELEKYKTGDRVRAIVLAFGCVTDLDPTAVSMLRDLLEAYQGQVTVVIADAKSRVRLLIEEHFSSASQKGKKPLLQQPAFMIGVEEAVEYARSVLADGSPSRSRAKTEM